MDKFDIMSKKIFRPIPSLIVSLKIQKKSQESISYINGGALSIPLENYL
jgi:hypothetical protein